MERRTIRFETRLSPSFVVPLDKWAKRKGIPTRAKAARLLMEIGLQAEAERENRGGETDRGEQK